MRRPFATRLGRYGSERPVLALPSTVLFTVVVPLIALTALGIVYALQFAGDVQEARLKEDLELIGRAVRMPIGRNLERGDLEGVQSALLSVFTIGRVYGASVYDTAGTRIASAGLAANELASSIAATTAVSTGEIQERYDELHGQDVFSQFLPVFDTGGRINGLIQITRRRGDFHAAMRQLERDAWILWATLSVVMTGVVVVGHYRGVGRHVNRILASMQRVERGEPGEPVPRGGPRELVLIGAGLNRMLAGMARAQAAVAAHRETEAALNDQLRHQEKMAAVGRIASGIAHELGAPMSVILGRARRLEQMLGSEPQAARQIVAIRQQSERLTALAQQLLEYCRPGNGAQRLIAPAALLRSTRHALAPELVGAVPAIGIEAAPDLPPVRGDPRRLELAMINLLRNAVQAARQQVEIGAHVVDERLQIAFDDDGPGLAAAPEQLVEPFFTTKAAGDGTGLGLAIVSHIVEEHGGRLHFGHSALGGCRVLLELPLAAPDGADA